MEVETTLDTKSLKVLGADTRQDILKELKERPHTASELSRHLNKHITTIKEHLDLLLEADLVERREREGRKWVYYYLSRKGERLFKPSYNWIVILGLSFICILSGFYLRVNFPIETPKMLAEGAAETMLPQPAPVNPVSFALIIAGFVGLFYLIYKRKLNALLLT